VLWVGKVFFFFPIPRGLFLELGPNYLITNSKVIFISNYFCEELIYLITNLSFFLKKQKEKLAYLITIYLLLFISKWV